MAIVNSFERCLDSPYLTADETAPERVPGLLEQARERLHSARALASADPGHPGDVVLLAYESMFASLRALVYRHGYREVGLRCLLLAAETLEVRPGRVNAAHLRAFERVQAHQLLPGEALEAADEFLRAVEGVPATGAGGAGQGN